MKIRKEPNPKIEATLQVLEVLLALVVLIVPWLMGIVVIIKRIF